MAAPTSPEPAMKHDAPLHLACTFDERMVLPAVVLIKSIAEHHRSVNVVVHVMHARGLEADIARITAELRSDTLDFVLYPAETDFGHLAGVTHYSKANFYRIDLMTRIQDVQRCIYLDCDIIVRRDLSDLFAIDLGALPVAACTDYLYRYYMPEMRKKIPYQGRWFTPDAYSTEVVGLTGDYLNSGVMVVDLPAWNREKISETVMAFCEARPGLAMVDQDGINAVLNGRFVEIDPRWNSHIYMTTIYRSSRRTPAPAWAAIIDLWTRDPWVIHFTYQSKPWEPLHYKTAYDDDFWRYIMTSSFGAAFLADYRKRVADLGFWRRGKAKKIPPIYN